MVLEAKPGPLKGSQVLCTADTSPALRTDQKGLWAECSEVVKHLPSIVNTSYNITDNKEKKKGKQIAFCFGSRQGGLYVVWAGLKLMVLVLLQPFRCQNTGKHYPCLGT